MNRRNLPPLPNPSILTAKLLNAILFSRRLSARMALLFLVSSFCLLLPRPFDSLAQTPPTTDEITMFLPQPTKVKLVQDWMFLRLQDPNGPKDSQAAPGLDDSSWETVALPHTPRIEPLIANHMWQDICWYRKHLDADPKWLNRKVSLDFDAAMSVADVWVNGEHVTTHYGGYLPFSIDLTGHLHPGDNVIALRLDNRNNREVPPGKPLRDLDFCWYGGLYRNVWLRVTDPLHISDPVQADRPAAGGIFVTYPQVSDESAEVDVQVDVENEYPSAASTAVRCQLLGPDGSAIEGERQEPIDVQAGANYLFHQKILVSHPSLWTPIHPTLYTLRSEVLKNGQVVDAQLTRIGIRRISFSASGGFQINGQRMYLRGTNRHQEYPFIGYALSDDAQYRDAVKIKEAGFDYIRLSHYPQSPAFLDACDELGLVVMEPIPGWQFMGNEVFKRNSFQNERDMIRRDRNHPSIVLWETSLNETWMRPPFTAQLRKIAHEEYPGDQCYTAGWVDAFDVYLQSRQAGGCHHFKNGDEACLISEYGDWEYYAQNSGLNQTEFKNLKDKERDSRQRRGDGEERLLRQLANFQESANDNRTTPAAGDGLWVMYDYSRGYATDLETSGVMDSLRLPKFSYYFFQSQRDASETGAGWDGGPMVHIASYWTDKSVLPIRVVSNCDEVELRLNGTLVARQKPDADPNSRLLPHPSFTFPISTFTPGTLEAIGYIGGRPVARHIVQTPGSPVKLRLWADADRRPLRGDGADAVFVYAAALDSSGTTVSTIDPTVTFTASARGSIVGDNPASGEAGIAGVLLRASAGGTITIHATAPGLETGELTLDAADVSPK
jgi:beta-galactosidase